MECNLVLAGTVVQRVKAVSGEGTDYATLRADSGTRDGRGVGWELTNAGQVGLRHGHELPGTASQRGTPGGWQTFVWHSEFTEGSCFFFFKQKTAYEIGQ